ncbi:MAG: TetR/AcrR family transcriptional regulator [Solirubrobacteraceae bacterium]
MPRTRPRQAAIRAPARPPRRLSRQARHEQLVEAALPVVAAQGLAGVSLDDVAARADVTRNLLYHYFPRGRPDLVLAVAERAGRLLTDDWVTDPSIPLPERLAANNARMIEHAMQPSDPWRIYRLARGSTDPELLETVDRFVDLVVSSIALNHLGTEDPPPLARLALRGYLAFFEVALDDARDAGIAPEQVLPVLGGTLVAALGAAG